MPQTPCFKELYANNGNNILGNEQAIILFSKGVGSYGSADSGRAFIPFAGATLNANGIYVPDTVGNNNTFIAAFAQFFADARQASINYVQNSVAFPQAFVDNGLQGYLYKKTFSVISDEQRYLQNAGIVFNFWANANLAWTNTEYYEALRKLKETIINTASKDLYIPNNRYLFGAALDATILAWKTANPNFVAFLGVELYQ